MNCKDCGSSYLIIWPDKQFHSWGCEHLRIRQGRTLMELGLFCPEPSKHGGEYVK